MEHCPQQYSTAPEPRFDHSCDFQFIVDDVQHFPFSASTLLVGRQEGHQGCKMLVVCSLVVTI